jgi:hypothetical protein
MINKFWNNNFDQLLVLQELMIYRKSSNKKESNLFMAEQYKK